MAKQAYKMGNLDSGDKFAEEARKMFELYPF